MTVSQRFYYLCGAVSQGAFGEMARELSCLRNVLSTKLQLAKGEFRVEFAEGAEESDYAAVDAYMRRWAKAHDVELTVFRSSAYEDENSTDVGVGAERLLD